MPNLNKDALDIWNALRPMIDKEIERRTRGAVQRRKAKVTTAPSLVTNKIGVTEPFGDQYFIPFNTNLSTAKVGDVVWVEFMYGATNAFASMYATADTKDVTVGGVLDVVQRRCSATLSSAGWYRVFLYSSTNDDELAGSKSANIRITITREGIVGNSFRNEVHFIDFSLAYGSYIFSNETSVTQSFAIDKIRYGYDLTNHFGFIDIHCKRNDSNPITVSFNVATDLETQGEMASVEPYSVADAPSGETVLSTFDFNTNTEGVTDGWHYTLQGKHIRATKTITDTLTNYTTMNGFFGYYIASITTPFTMASAKYYVGTTWSIGIGFSISAGILAKTINSFNAYALSTASGSQDVELSIVIEGEIA